MNTHNKLVLASIAIKVQELEDLGIEATFQLIAGSLCVLALRRDDDELRKPALKSNILFFLDVPVWDYEDDQDALSEILDNAANELKTITQNLQAEESDDDEDDEEFF